MSMTERVDSLGGNLSVTGHRPRHRIEASIPLPPDAVVGPGDRPYRDPSACKAIPVATARFNESTSPLIGIRTR